MGLAAAGRSPQAQFHSLKYLQASNTANVFINMHMDGKKNGRHFSFQTNNKKRGVLNFSKSGPTDLRDPYLPIVFSCEIF